MSFANRWRSFFASCVRLIVLKGTVLAFCATAAFAQEMTRGTEAMAFRFVRIATGPAGGTYFPVGGLIASAISNPPGSRPCDKGGSCGVPGLIAVAQSTSGSVANVQALSSRQVDLALMQADVAYWASSKTGLYAKKDGLPELRALARLYREEVHLIARKGAAISSVADLKGKRVSLGSDGSGTQVDASLILDAFGVKKKELKVSALAPGVAADALVADDLDAFFFVGGAPLPFLQPILAAKAAVLVPIEGAHVKKLVERNPFFFEGIIPAETYPDVSEVKTLTVGALLTTRDDVPEALITGIMRALWHPNNQVLIRNGNPVVEGLRLDQAALGVGISLHPAAAAYYKEMGLKTE